jgi:hypothetical protein
LENTGGWRVIRVMKKEKRPVDSKALLIVRIRFQRSAPCEYIWFVEHGKLYVYKV